MTEIKIYVVTSELKHDYERDCLTQLKIELLSKFNGLTVIKNCEGLWLDENKKIITDTVDIWQIVTHEYNLNYLWEVNEKLRRVCKQTAQLFTVDGHPFHVDKPLTYLKY